MCLSFCFLQAQKVKVEGFVKQSVNGFPTTFIGLYNAINKSSVNPSITSNKDMVTYTDDKGYFSIDAKPSDSLFIWNNTRKYYPQKYAVSDIMKKKNFVIEFKEKPCITEKNVIRKNLQRYMLLSGKR